MDNDSLYDNWKDYLVDMHLGYLESHTENVDKKPMDDYRDVGMEPGDFYSEVD